MYSSLEILKKVLLLVLNVLCHTFHFRNLEKNKTHNHNKCRTTRFLTIDIQYFIFTISCVYQNTVLDEKLNTIDFPQ